MPKQFWRTRLQVFFIFVLFLNNRSISNHMCYVASNSGQDGKRRTSAVTWTSQKHRTKLSTPFPQCCLSGYSFLRRNCTATGMGLSLHLYIEFVVSYKSLVFWSSSERHFREPWKEPKEVKVKCWQYRKVS